ncbi:MAG: 3-hydroxyacyl-CoA dehydrogenase/enoyl-CoA hydratase/3-hydroxybutyryl-CoA epimerase [Lentimonas sp.]|jgi:3-hydroxyacyl-CoA dehydrogenase/enoyl-CoA hydratase/3-hydroxybutyryl-CoA epimerase
MKYLKFNRTNGTATLTFDRPDSTANILDEDTLSELLNLLKEIEQDDSITALLICSAKPNVFIAGADIPSLSNCTPGELAALIDLGHEAFSLLESLSIPTIAAIHGACLGGGYELALACDWRIASDDKCTKIGLPETRLGILPAWGGCTRLPRLITLPNALPLILGGKNYSAKAAARKELIDATVHQAHLGKVALKYLQRGKRSSNNKHAVLHNPASVKVIEATARKDLLKRTRGLYPAPLKALEVICQAVTHPLAFGFRLERDALIELASQSETSHLTDLFLLSQKAKKRTFNQIEPLGFKAPAVIGSGIMGSGISYWLSRQGYPVLLKDISDAALAQGMQSIKGHYAKALSREIGTTTEAQAGIDRIHASAELVPLHRRDLIIEAAVENLEVKKRIFAELSNRCTPECILASNTSALPIHQLAQMVDHPERVVGLHFFNPVHRMPLVEVVQASCTSDATLASAVRFVQKIGKIPIIVQDSPGFLVNRILMPYLLEASKMFAAGGDPIEIDQAMLNFGMPMGPLRLLDEVGLDVAKDVAATLINAFPDRMSLPPILDRMIEYGYLGRKAGKGFYLYGKSEPLPNPAVLVLREADALKLTAVAEQLAGLMSDEAARCMDENIVASPEDIDLAMVLGTGYAPCRGGPLRYADDQRLISPGFYQDHPHHRMVG